MNPTLRSEASIAWHSLAEPAVLARLESDWDGLAAGEVAARQRQYGANELPRAKTPSLAVIFFGQLKSPLIYILLAAAAVSVAMGDVSDAGFILFVVVLNATLGTGQEWKANREAAALQKLLRIAAQVKRGGVRGAVDAAELVPGDLVFLESGLRVPADLRLLTVNGLRVDEALLTGESVAVAKQAEVLEEDKGLAERTNMAFAGTLVESGRGVGVVVATGMRTEVGKISKSVAETEQSRPPLLVRMDQFARQVSWAVAGACGILGLVAWLRGTPLEEVFFLAVALAVAAIPEGLPVAITVALSIATSRMAKRNVIVRRLTAVEGLGSCTYIASDKTGTLTVNRQRVEEVWTPDGQERRAAVAFWAATASENEAKREGEQWVFTGDAVDVACWELAREAGLDLAALRGLRRLEVIPYESERAYAVTFFEEHGERRAALKGAPEVVLAMCRGQRGRDGVEPLDRAVAEAAMNRLSGAGQRVLAVASASDLSDETGARHPLPAFVLEGLIGLLDPPRPEAREAVERCRAAGIRVAMVTGDHPLTALAIARQVGIEAAPDNVVTGKELEQIGTPDAPLFLETVEWGRVFARVNPLQKLQIVESLRQLGHFVAVTGDGINDAPALKRAHVGVAMGSGTDVAKETASILVTDDNFASIEAGVEEGRFAYDNIRKVTYLLITAGFAEILLFALCAVVGLPLPLLPVHLLWLNLVANGIQDVSLAFERGEKASVKRPPRSPREGVFNQLMVEQVVWAGVVTAAVAFAGFYWLVEVERVALADARTKLLLLLIWVMNFHAFNCRSEYTSAFRIPLNRNWMLIGGVAAAQGLNALAMALPLGREVLKVTQVSFEQWIIPCGAGVCALLAMELFKWRRHGAAVAWARPD